MVRALLLFRSRIAGSLASFGKRLKGTKTEQISHIRARLLKGGFRKPNDLFTFWGAKYALGALLPLLFIAFIAATSWQPPSHLKIAISCYLVVVGFYLPNIFLRKRIAYRRTKMIQGLPDALDLMVVCVGAGMGLDAAFSRVAEEIKLSNKVVGEEFQLLNLELRAGKHRRDALRNLSLRNDVEELDSLVTLLVQTDRFGTSVSEALRVYSDTMRTRRFQRAEEIAQKLPIKLIFPMILCIFPALFVVILAPAVIKILRFFTKHFTGL